MTREEIVRCLRGECDEELFARSAKIREELYGTKVFLRGLVELSNVCRCDCYYCGIRRSNSAAQRYTLSVEAVLSAVKRAYDEGWYSVVLQCGEQRSESFTRYIEELIRGVKELSDGRIGITLSCGEQSQEVFCRWREAGADRYLLRIESSNVELFEKLHPAEINFEERKASLRVLHSLGYQTGTGVMIGLPFQSIESLVDDILFLSSTDYVMCGMGPYIEHSDTPLSATESPYTRAERVVLTLRMIAILRILRPEINIASSTALGTLDAAARHRAMAIGANVLMPNITPSADRSHYSLYEGKITDLDLTGFDIAYSHRGDALASKKLENKKN